MNTTTPLLIRPVYFSYGSTPTSHPSLFDRLTPPVDPPPRKLYLIPTPDFFEGEELDDIPPIPSRLDELPPLSQWVRSYIHSVVEIWSGRRPASQLMRWTHSSIYSRLTREVGTKSIKIHRIHIAQPLEGICEATITVKQGDRVRVLLLRFEGADKKWKCTFLEMI